MVAVNGETPVAAFFKTESTHGNKANFDYFGNPALVISNQDASDHQHGLTAIAAHLTKSGLRSKIRGSHKIYDVAFSPESIEGTSPFVESLLRESQSLVPWVLRKKLLQTSDGGSDDLELSWPRRTDESLKRARDMGLEAQVFDGVSAKAAMEKIFWDFRDLHFLAAGRKTRSEESWHEQLRLIRKEKAFLVIASIAGKTVGGAYFNMGFNSV